MAGSTLALTANPSQSSTFNICDLDAAEAVLGAQPPATTIGTIPCSSLTENLRHQYTQNISCKMAMPRWDGTMSKEIAPSASHGFIMEPSGDCEPENDSFLSSRRPRSESVGLDTLAAMALREQMESPNRPLPSFLLPQTVHGSSSAIAVNNGSDEGKLPTPIRNGETSGRHRSFSNPEGMEKWDSYGSSRYRSNRLHFFLPAEILEEELAEANEAVRLRSISKSPIRSCPIPEHSEFLEEHCEPPCDTNNSSLAFPPPILFRVSETDEQSLLPEDILRNARLRLLEDVSAEPSAFNGDKIITLPHTVAKYKELYNKNGRIGIYTPAERATIIARFNEKRSRRNWNKKIRYNCRKNLADRRLRVKGRFVKRSDQEELAKLIDDERISIETDNQKRVSISEVVDIHTPVLDSEEGDEDDSSNDEDMPDTSDPDADFVPTEDQPYRRLRRHTIT